MKKRLKITLKVFMVIVILIVGLSNITLAADSDEDKTNIDFWATQWQEQEVEWVEKWVEKYNESQDNVIVNLEVIPDDAWQERIKSAQAAGNAPDVRTINYNKIVFSANQGELTALDDYVDSSIFDDLYSNIEDFVVLNGKHYAYPINAEPSSVLFYRKDMFEEAGLDPEQPPKTWDELIEYGKKLSKGNTAGLAAAGNTIELSWTHWGLQRMVDAYPINDDWSEATINTPEFQKLIEFWGTLYKEGILPRQGFETGYNVIAPLADGRAAMQISGSWVIAQLRNDYPEIVDEIGVAVMPTPDGNQEKPTSTLGGWTMAIDGNSEKPEAAADFISWFLAGNEEIMVEYFKDITKFSKFSPRKSVDEVLSNDPQAQSDPWRKMISEKIVPYAAPEPIYAWEISMSYANAVERVMLAGVSVEESLEQAEKEINNYIENNDYSGTNPKNN